MSTNAVIELAAKDLNQQGGVHCPTALADMKLWNTHPKVYIDVAHTGEGKCPYCGTVVTLSDHDWALSVIKGISQRTVG